jgi:dihydroorotate dehydrogenase
MPDWTYHPIWRPIMFRLPGEDARRLTIGYLDLQGRTRPGRALFRVLSHGIPDTVHAVNALGVTFPSRYGFGPHLDRDGRAAPVSQFLGGGFLTVGPVSWQAQPRVRSLDAQRLTDAHGIAWTDLGYSPGADDVATRLEQVANLLEIPLGVAVAGRHADRTLTRLGTLPNFVSVSLHAINYADSAEQLDSLRAATSRPLLLRLDMSGHDDQLLTTASAAIIHGFDGIVVGDGYAYAGLPHGRSTAPASTDRTLRLVDALRVLHGPTLPIVASGAVLTPPDAAACVAAGATLVEVTSGFVYSGPGIAARSLSAQAPPPQPPMRPRDSVGAWVRHGVWWAVAAAALAFAVVALPRSVLQAASAGGLLVIPSVVGAQWEVAAATLICAAIILVCQRLYCHDYRWAVWLLLLCGLTLTMVSPALGLPGCLLLMIAGSKDRLLPATFRSLFEGPSTAWRWSAANLGRVSVTVGVACDLVPLLILAPEPGQVTVFVGVCGVVGLVVFLRAMHPGARYLWWYTLGWVSAFGAAALWLLDGRAPAVLGVVSGALEVAGLLWLWRPLIECDESPGPFPDV